MDSAMVTCSQYQPEGHHFVLGHCCLLHLELCLLSELKMDYSVHFETKKRNTQLVTQKANWYGNLTVKFRKQNSHTCSVAAFIIGS